MEGRRKGENMRRVVRTAKGISQIACQFSQLLYSVIHLSPPYSQLLYIFQPQEAKKQFRCIPVSAFRKACWWVALMGQRLWDKARGTIGTSQLYVFSPLPLPHRGWGAWLSFTNLEMSPAYILLICHSPKQVVLTHFNVFYICFPK